MILGIHVIRSFVPRPWIRTQESNYQITLCKRCVYTSEQLRVIASPKRILAELRITHYKHPPASPGHHYFPLSLYIYILGCFQLQSTFISCSQFKHLIIDHGDSSKTLRKSTATRNLSPKQSSFGNIWMHKEYTATRHSYPVSRRNKRKYV